MENTLRPRYANIDKLKFFSAFLIVCIHAPFPGALGEYFVALTRIAVPLFLMISGFFYKAQYGLKQIKKILILTAAAYAIYLVYHIGVGIIGGGVMPFLQKLIDPKNVLKFLLVNETLLSGHLWYLGAILYVLIIVTLLFRLNEKASRKVLYFLTPLLLLGDLLLGKYSVAIFGREFDYLIVRNWLFVGIPYFTVGLFMRENIEKLRKIPGAVLVILMAVFSLTTILERSLLVHFDVNAPRDHYLSTTLLSVVIFLFFEKAVSKKEDLVSKIGKEDSTWIYILHPIVIFVLGKLPLPQTAYFYVRPVVVFIVTTIGVMIMLKLMSLIKRKK